MQQISIGRKLKAAIAYIPVIFLIPLLAFVGDDYIQFHGKQGLALFMVWFVLWVIGLIPLVGLVVPFGYLALIIIIIIGIANAMAGRKWVVPLVGKYAERFRL
jgi:uncharacterized membrane protein